MLRKTAPSNLARTAPGLPTPIREDYRTAQKFKHVAASLPFKIESEEEMQNRLDVILARLVQAVESRDYEYGLLQWDSILASYVFLHEY
jgi:hypothetical protein